MCHVGFYVAYLVIRGMRVILLLTADTFLHYSWRRVSTDYHKFGVLTRETL